MLVGLAAIGVELGETAPIEILLVLVGAGERQIDVVEHVGIARARLARRARHQPFGECRDGLALLVIEEHAVAVECIGRSWTTSWASTTTGEPAACALAAGCTTLFDLAYAVCTRAGAGGRSCANRADNKRAAAMIVAIVIVIVLAHGFPPRPAAGAMRRLSHHDGQAFICRDAPTCPLIRTDGWHEPLRSYQRAASSWITSILG